MDIIIPIVPALAFSILSLNGNRILINPWLKKMTKPLVNRAIKDNRVAVMGMGPSRLWADGLG